MSHHFKNLIQFNNKVVNMSYHSTKNNRLKILSFNILAETWFNNQFYEKEIHNDLNKYFPNEKKNMFSTRVKTLKTYLNNLIQTNLYDVICLQETEDYFCEYIKKTYSDEYLIYDVYHDKTIWVDWITDELPYYSNGLLTMIKKNKFSKVKSYKIRLDTSNNIIFTTCSDFSNKKYNFVNAHLDTEDENINKNRYIELSNITKKIKEHNADFNFVIGDLNDGTYGVASQELLINKKFVDLFAITNNLSSTLPIYFDTDKEKNLFSYDDNSTIIDKIFLKTKHQPISINTKIHNEHKKIIDSLLYTGSDHYAIDCDIVF